MTTSPPVVYNVPFDKAHKRVKETEESSTPDRKNSRATGVGGSLKRGVSSAVRVKRSPEGRAQDADERKKGSAPGEPLLSQDIYWFFVKNWTGMKEYKHSLGVKSTHRKAKLTLTLTYLPDERQSVPRKTERNVEDGDGTVEGTTYQDAVG